MKVYVILEHMMHHGSSIVAIFDSKEKADDYIHNNEPDDNSRCWLDWEEYEVG